MYGKFDQVHIPHIFVLLSNIKPLQRCNKLLQTYYKVKEYVQIQSKQIQHSIYQDKFSINPKMNHTPSIHDAYGGFGERSQFKPSSNINTTTTQLKQPQPVPNQKQPSNKKLPNDASYSNYPTQIRCPKCSNVCITRMQSQLGTAAWLWCVLLAPFACMGLACMCIQSCKDKIHYCTRCGHIVGKKYAKAC